MHCQNQEQQHVWIFPKGCFFVVHFKIERSCDSDWTSWQYHELEPADMCWFRESWKGKFTTDLAVSNDSELMRAFRYEAGWQPVEQGVIPHQAHRGRADDEQRPILWVAGCNADCLRSQMNVWVKTQNNQWINNEKISLAGLLLLLFLLLLVFLYIIYCL